MNADFELKKRRVLAVFLASGLLTGAGSAVAQSGDTAASSAGTSRSFECTNVSVDYANDPNLTREERIRLMDQALFQSLGQYDACEAERSAAASGGAAGATGAGGQSAADGNAGELGQSVASSDMSGDEAPTDQGEAKWQEQGEAATGATGTPSQQDAQQAKWSNPDANDGTLNPEYLDDNDAKKAREQGGGNGGRVKHGNGKIPEDIPAADNDSVLEAQIRRAAINETDPETKARLWNEYRKYKGLPTRVSAKSEGES